ncbi:MAG: AmmeMemoRadiSam system protein B [Chloroflexota bacterium]
MTAVSRELRPRLRAVEVTPIQYQGRRIICLKDTSDPDTSQLAVSQEALALLSLMDGTRTVDDIVSDAVVRWSVHVSTRELHELITAADEAFLFDNARYAERRNLMREAFTRQSARPAIHAGGAYPANPVTLRQFMDQQYLAPEGPGALPAGRGASSIRAAIIPHVDLRRGGPTYAWAYRELARAEPVDCYLLLGTCHSVMTQPFAALPIPYDTPFGLAPVDLDLLSRIETQLGPRIYDDALSHQSEHSLEFQAVYLRALSLVGDNSRAGIVPILCQALQAYVEPDESPRSTDQGRQFVAAVTQAIVESGKRVCIVAGADLAHVGPQFGDERNVDPATLQAVEQRDRALLEIVCRGDAEGFYQHVIEDQDARRICGLAPIYYALAISGAPTGQLLRYTQWADPLGQSAVTFASVVFPS